MTIAATSGVGKAMIGLSTFGLIIQMTLMVLLIMKRETRVIKAASVGPSLIILCGRAYFESNEKVGSLFATTKHIIHV